MILNEHVELILEDREPGVRLQIAQLVPASCSVRGTDAAAPATLEKTALSWGVFALPVAGDQSGGAPRPEYTLLGTGGETVPYPSLFKSNNTSVLDKIFSSCILHPQPAFPRGDAHFLQAASVKPFLSLISELMNFRRPYFF